MRSLVSGATDADEEPIMMYNNYRSVQNLNGRSVFSVTTTAPTTLPATTAAAGTALPSATMLSLAVLLTVSLFRRD